MSLQFSDSENKTGICELIDEECGTNVFSYPLKKKARDVNLAFDDFFAIAIQASGTWQIDDTNHSKHPIIKRNLVQGRRDYVFTADQQGNLILDIYKVFVANSSGVYYEILPTDVQSEDQTESFSDGQNTTGKPSKYDKTGNAIFLDVPPDYSYALGLKVYINREASYFVYTDTTKKPGVVGLFHRYFVVHPAYRYAIRKNKRKAPALKAELEKLEAGIREYYGSREKDKRSKLTGKQAGFR